MIVSAFCENRPINAPDEFYDSLPKVCEECGYPMEMTEVLTQLHCSNPRCPSKVAQRMVSIATALGVKDLGEARARSFVNYFGITNPLLIFGYEPEEDGAMSDEISMDTSLKIAHQFNTKRKFTLAEYVRIANLPFIQMSAFQLFDGFDDLNKAYKAIERDGVVGLQEKLGIVGDGTVSVRALKCYESLMTFKDDLIQGLEWVDIIPIHKPDMIRIKACCSTEVGGTFRTKADFYATCNNLYPNIHIEFGSSVTKTTEYLIWGGSAETNKVKKARAYQAQGVDIKIMTGLEFLGVLKNLSGGE